MLLVRCPHCVQRMKTDPKNVLKSVKKCVYCGKTFRVHVPGESRILLRLDAR